MEETYIEYYVRVAVVEFAVQIFLPVANLKLLHKQLHSKIIV